MSEEAVFTGSRSTVVQTEVKLAVPEPSTWAMMLLGFVGLGYAGLRKARLVRSIA